MSTETVLHGLVIATIAFVVGFLAGLLSNRSARNQSRIRVRDGTVYLHPLTKLDDMQRRPH